MNALLGEKLSIITPKAQTTRHRIRGILNGDDFQIVFSDTPGIIPEPHYKLHQAMMNFVNETFSDADIILFVMDINDPAPIDEKTLSKLKKLKTPLLLLINKIDLGNQNILETKVEEWKKILPNAEIIPVSATEKFNCDYLLERILALSPESPPYFPKEDISDKSQRFFVSEIIREKIFLFYREEIPYSTEVIIEEFKEEKNIVRILANIIVMRESQKGIIIGHKGKALKKTVAEAKKDIEEFLGKKVFLKIIVKVEKNWRDDERKLKRFGYLT
jgi:GTP-binding protein Era